MACRLERSRQWAIRCTHEASLYERNCFITLTFDEASLPSPPSLDVRHWQLFMKRLKKANNGKSIRFYMGAEYGTKGGRPHYHAILFNHDFDDKVIHTYNSRGEPIYTSRSLERVWKQGYCSVAACTFESASYVARYCTKKVTGDAAHDHYQYIDADGVVHQLTPEFSTQSKVPGIGVPWLKKYFTDVYDHDHVVVRNRVMRPPRAYDKLYESWYSYLYAATKELRLERAPTPADALQFLRAHTGVGFGENTPDRLRARSEVLQARVSQLKRSL